MDRQYSQNPCSDADQAGEPILEVRGVGHSYGEDRVLQNINLSVRAGEIVCLLGASGSGKSTLLRVLAGLEPLQEGEVTYRGELLAVPGREPPPEARNFGFVFQDHVLFPHLTVFDNVAFGLATRSSSEKKSRVNEHLAQVGLLEFAQRYPHTLSGGQQQRVALARALAPEPGLMLLDEPFASVDSTLRRRLREDARRTLRASGVPSIIVTHDPEEAMELADRIAVIHRGTIVQNDVPAEVWRQPGDRFIAELFGATDAISGVGSADGVQTAFGLISGLDVPAGQAADIIVRAGGVRVSASSAGPASIADVRFLGDRYLIIAEQEGKRMRVLLGQSPDFKVGDRVQLHFDSANLFVYLSDENDSHLN